MGPTFGDTALGANARTSHSDRKIESDAAAFLQLFYSFSTAFLQGNGEGNGGGKLALSHPNPHESFALCSMEKAS